jgi:pilus assembly protein FimV
VRKSGIILSLWTALLCFPLSSFALGLGEIEVNSFLNQPLKADIEVLAARPGEIDDLLVSLASRDAFRKAGLERSSDLSKLRFKIEKSEDGQSAKILVTTKSAIKEPFLNFLIEADWAKGRLLREYTVLLDPPYFAQQAQQAAPKLANEPAAAPQTAPIAQPETQTNDSMVMGAEADAQPQPIALSGQTAQPIADEEPAQEYTPQATYTETSPVEDEIVVSRGDTLWEIASRLKDDEHSMAQVMLAIQAVNPDAFAHNNINNLKVGAVIRVPSSGSFDDLTKQQAYAQVLEQNGLWDDYVARKTGTAVAGSPMADQTASSEPAEVQSGQLSLLAPGDKDSTSASMTSDSASMTSDDSADTNQLRKQLALAEEELEASRLENQDLQSRVTDLEQQLKKVEELQKIVQITDNSMAELQQQASETETTDVPEVPATEEMDNISEEQPSDVMIDAAQKIAAEDAEQLGDDIGQPDDVMVEEGESDQATDTMAQSTEAETVLPTLPEQETPSAETSDGMMADEQIVEPDQTDSVPAPAPVIVTDSQDGISDMVPPVDSLLGDPIVLGGIAAIVLLLLGLLFVRRRKTSEPEQGITIEEPDETLVDDDVTPIHIPTVDEAELTQASEEVEELADTATMQAEPFDEEEDEFAKTAVVSAEEAEQTQKESSAIEAEQDDVLNEVDVYLAYGLYDNAEDLLKENLENSPDRADYRAKLLDTFFATKNKDQFIKEAEALKSLGGAADRYWNRVQIMGYELAPENDLFAGAQDSDLSVADLEFAKPETADFDIGVDDDITDYSNTDFDLNVDTQNFEAVDPTVVKPKADELTDTQSMEPVLDDFSETMVDKELDLPELEGEEELPDEIGAFDLDLGDEEASDAEDLDLLNDENNEVVDEENAEDDDALSFDLPDDLDLSTGVEDMADDADIIQLDDTVEAPDQEELPAMDDEIELELDSGEDIEVELDDVDVELDDDAQQAEDDKFNSTDEIDLADIVLDEADDTSQTMVMDSNELNAEVEEDEDIEATQHVDSALDLDMSDIESADLQSGSFEPSEVEGYSPEEDIEIDGDDITEFRPAEMTGEFEVPAEVDVHEEIDPDAGIEKTGTFAPGDFGDDELDDIASLEDGMDDIEDLMLPDDVDEVGTKLDLAKAFIDMGDAEGARSSLEEVLSEGTEEQKAEATGLLQQIK